MKRVWTLPLLFALGGAALATTSAVSGNPGTAAVLLLVFLVVAAVHSPLIFPKPVGLRKAQGRSAADGRPVVLWRPGCMYCIRLRLRLGRSAGRLHWVDIWRDPAGAEAARAANEGNETVPTVLIAGRPHTNPDPAWVREQLSAST